MPTRPTTIKMVKETPVTMTMTTTASLMTETTAGWCPILTRRTLMVMAEAMPAKTTLTMTMCQTLMTSVLRMLTSVKPISADSR